MLNELLVEHEAAGALASIPEIFPWQPVRWPIHWCELLNQQPQGGDCGVHAHVASEVLTAHGIKHRRSRAVIDCDPMVVSHWRRLWQDELAESNWIANDRLVYHEVVRVSHRWWDPTELCWIDTLGDSVSSGRVVALTADDESWMTL